MQIAHGTTPVADRPGAPGAPREQRIADAFALLEQAANYEREKFEGDPDEDLNVSGGDLVDWFSTFRSRADALVKAESQLKPEGLPL